MAKQVANGTNTNIGLKETFLDRNAKLIPSDEDTMALTNAKWIAGHHTVETLNDLYNIKPFILNPKYYAQSDEDTNHVQTIGQLWYVVGENAFYQLIDWDKRDTKDGWSKTNIKAIKGPDGRNNEQHIGPADFITKVSINGDGTLTGTTGTFQNEQTNNFGKFSSSVEGLTINYDKSQVLTYAYIDKNGKLWTEASGLKQPIHKIDITSNESTVTLSYQGISGADNILQTKLQNKKYEIPFPVASIDKAGILNVDTYTYFENAYTYHNTAYEWIRSNAITKSGNNTNPNIIQTYFGGTYSHVKSLSVSHGTDENGVEYTQLNSESESFKLPNLGTNEWDAYPGNAGKANRDDIDAIYNGDKPLVSPTITTTKYTIYKADGTTKISTGTSNPSNIDYGSWIEWTGTFKWTHNDNYKDPTATSGSFGTTLPSSGVASSPYTFTKKQLTGNVTFASQSLSAPKKGLMLVGQKILRASGDDITSASLGTGVFKKKYWGFVENRSSITEGVILGLQNVSTSGTNKGMVFNDGVAKTGAVGSGKVYLIYAYPASNGKLTQASVPGADATGWFNIKIEGGPQTLSITNPTNGYTEDYYVYYTVAQNALSGAALTLS